MILKSPAFFRPVLGLASLVGGTLFANVTVTPDHSSGVYSLGEPVVWMINATGADSAARTLSYTLKKDDYIEVSSGVIELADGPVRISAMRNDAGMLVARITVPGQDDPVAMGAAIFAPDAITPSLPAPTDFAAFWEAKLSELSDVAMNPRVEKTYPAESDETVDYFKVTLDNIRGTRVRGQLARPVAPGKYPAIITFQYAGVYPLHKPTVIDDAKAGWLAFNISAHDLPIDEPAEFYAQLKSGALKDYIHIGDEDRETSYFLRVILGCVRAVDYIASRPDWDGRTLLVCGTSQGGLQSFAAAGLSDKVTGLMVNVPAGCDNHAPMADRAIGWPYWLSDRSTQGRDMNKVAATAGYYDAINFAARVRCPALVAYGLLDTVARPTGIAAAINALQGPKQVVIMADSDHRGPGDAQQPYHDAASLWKQTALRGNWLPPALSAAARDSDDSN